MPYIGNITSDFSIDTGNITNRAVTATKLSPSSVGSNGQVLSVDGSGNLQWGNDANAPEGTAVLSTGESGTTKYLRVDGDGTCSWQVPPNTQLSFSNDANNRVVTGTGSGLNGEANLTYDGTDFTQKVNSSTAYSSTATPQKGFQIQNEDDTTNSFSALRLTSGSSSPATAQISSIRTGTGQNDLAFQLETSNTAFEALRITSTGKVGIGTTSPGYKLELSGTDNNSYLSLENTTAADTDGSRYSRILFRGTQSGGEISSLAAINGAHDGTADDQKGLLTLRTNDGNDGESPTARMYIDSSGRVSIQGAATRAHLEVRSSGGSNTMLTALFGANEGVTTGALTDDTDKGCRIGIQHYDTDALPFAWISAASGSSANSINMGGGTSLMNAATAVGIYTASDTTTATGTKRFIVESDGTLHKYLDGSTIQASFGGSGQVNGITALPSMAANPFVVGRDTGSTRSAHFGGHLKFDSGYGIDFSAVSDGSRSVGSNVLDDYEEGTFTPNITDGSTSCGSYDQNKGWYTKVGNLVSVQVRFQNANPTGLTGGNVLYVNGLPFPMDSGTGRIQVGQVELDNFDLDSSTRSVSTFSNIGSGSVTWFRIFQTRDNSNHLALNVSAMNSSDNELNASITYQAA